MNIVNFLKVYTKWVKSHEDENCSYKEDKAKKRISDTYVYCHVTLFHERKIAVARWLGEQPAEQKATVSMSTWLSGRGKRIERLDIDDLYVVITDVVDGFLVLLPLHKQICELNYKNNKLKLS